MERKIEKSLSYEEPILQIWWTFARKPYGSVMIGRLRSLGGSKLLQQDCVKLTVRSPRREMRLVEFAQQTQRFGFGTGGDLVVGKQVADGLRAISEQSALVLSG